MTWPSTVTTRLRQSRLRATREASLISSTTMIRPKRFATMLSYLASHFTKSAATRAEPERREASIRAPLTVSSGKKVARPAFSSRKKAMAALAALSPSTTMFCSAKPSAVSMASS